MISIKNRSGQTWIRKEMLPVATAFLLVACSGSNTDQPQTTTTTGEVTIPTTGEVTIPTTGEVTIPTTGGTIPTTTEVTTPTSGDTTTISCAETGVVAAFACKTGTTEPLYTFQWALQYASSFFKDFTDAFSGGSDLNVEPVHLAGIKGQGVNVLVLDDGLDVNHEDLKPNVDSSMTYNFFNSTIDPTPTGVSDAHGTNVAGMIAAAQNSLGVMGIAPRSILGGAAFIGAGNANALEAYGGAEWSKKAHIINASYGVVPTVPPAYGTTVDATQASLEALYKLRDGKGTIYVKASGNQFQRHTDTGRSCPTLNNLISCENPAHDTETLVPTVIAVGAANAKGRKASYANAGSVNWITGLAGEFGASGMYGEGAGGSITDPDGPVIFSTDLSGCDKGYARTGSNSTDFLKGITERNSVKDNANCHYSYMNGTSAATPTISGVVALVLQANPALTWRDVRDILRLSARQIDTDYGTRDKRNSLFDLVNNGLTTEVSASAAAITTAGATKVPLDLGWVKNAAGNWYSNWYGFGLPDAEKAVKLAKDYAANPALSKTATLTIPQFEAQQTFNMVYGQVSKIATFTAPAELDAKKLDQLQVRLSGNLCIGSIGVAVKSPAGTVSLLSVPYNIFFNSAQNSGVTDYGLGSYAFYGEPAKGDWTVYLLAGTPNGNCNLTPASSKVDVRFISQP